VGQHVKHNAYKIIPSKLLGVIHVPNKFNSLNPRFPSPTLASNAMISKQETKKEKIKQGFIHSSKQ